MDRYKAASKRAALFISETGTSVIKHENEKDIFSTGIHVV